MRLLLCFTFISQLLVAHHNIACHFSYEVLSNKKLKVTLVTYIDRKAKEYIESPTTYRDSVQFFWGDQTESFIKRLEGTGELLNNNIVKNTYVGEHTYLQYGNYKIGFFDPYRTEDVNNMLKGASGSTLLFIDGIVPLQDGRDSCSNNAAYPLLDPYFYPESGKEFKMNLSYYDKDGDSLSYKMINCKGATKSGDDAKDYFIPSSATINQNGTFTFANPGQDSIYCFAYEVSEYRNQKIIGKSIFDFTLFVDKLNTSQGSFSDTKGLTNNGIEYTFPVTKEFSYSFSNPLADTVITSFAFGGLVNGSFDIENRSKTIKNSINDTLDIEYIGNDKKDGKYASTVFIKSVFGSDTVYSYLPIYIKSDDYIEHSCLVPNIYYNNKGPNNIAENLIAPSFFENEVWVNLGDAFENSTIKIYDLRGRIVLHRFAFQDKVLKLDLSFLERACYIAEFTNTNGIRITQKIVRK